MADSSSKTAQAEQTTKGHMLAALAVALLPIPWVDTVALAGIQLNLVRSLANLYGVEFSSQLGKSAISSLIGGAVPVSLSVNMARIVNQGLPGLGLFGATSVAVLGAASTYAIGQVFTQHFASGNNLFGFDPEKVRDYYIQQYEKGKEKALMNFAGQKP